MYTALQTANASSHTPKAIYFFKTRSPGHLSLPGFGCVIRINSSLVTSGSVATNPAWRCGGDQRAGEKEGFATLYLQGIGKEDGGKCGTGWYDVLRELIKFKVLPVWLLFFSDKHSFQACQLTLHRHHQGYWCGRSGRLT